MGSNRIVVTESYVVVGDDTSREGSQFYTDPSLTQCSDGSYLLCTLVDPVEKLGADGGFRAFRSAGDLERWDEINSPTCHDEALDSRYSYRLCFITERAAGRLLASYVRVNRFNPEEPQFHPDTDGMQYSEVRLTSSTDGGASWVEPRTLDYLLPDMIMAGGFVDLPDGTIGIPCEVWHEWDKGWREWPSTRLIRSFDDGESWPVASIIAEDPSRRFIHGDPKLTVLPDGRIVALLWKYDLQRKEDLPVHRSESRDSGVTWSAPQDTGIIAQRSHPTSLGGGLLLCVYQKRFGDDAGLRAVLSSDGGESWNRETDAAIWTMGQHTRDTNPFTGYARGYSFGYSSSLKTSDREVLVSFWMSNGKTTYVRLVKLHVE